MYGIYSLGRRTSSIPVLTYRYKLGKITQVLLYKKIYVIVTLGIQYFLVL